MEQVFVAKSRTVPAERMLVCGTRYGNVLASRGSVIPLFHVQISTGGTVTITTTDMTRFLLSLDQAVDTIFAAVREGERGDTYIPRVPSSAVVDIAAALIGDRPIKTVVTGIRPGEKLHEILVSEEERFRTIARGDYYVITSILPEIRPAGQKLELVLNDEYSSAHDVMSPQQTEALLRKFKLMLEDQNPASDEELLR